jgi:protein-disulfide isomerase
MRSVLMRRVLDVTLILCALATTGAVISRSSLFQKSNADGETVFPGWKEDLTFNRRIGRAYAPYHLVVWTDYQCPACKQFEQQLGAVRSQLKDSLAVVYRYYPLAMHPLAFRAAVAAECARDQGRFEAMHTTLFATQLVGDSLPITSLVSASQIPDTSAFRRCLTDSTAQATVAVRTDMARAQTLNLRGTPGLQIGDHVGTGGMLAPELMSRLRATRR